MYKEAADSAMLPNSLFWACPLARRGVGSSPFILDLALAMHSCTSARSRLASGVAPAVQALHIAVPDFIFNV